MLSKHLPPRTNRQLQCLRNATLRNTNASGSVRTLLRIDGLYGSVSVVAVLLGGGPPGSVPVTRRDSHKIWPLRRALSVDLSVVVAGTGLAHQLA